MFSFGMFLRRLSDLFIITRNWQLHDDAIKWKLFLALCEGNPSVTCGFPSQRPVTQSYEIFLWSSPDQTVKQKIEIPGMHYDVTVMTPNTISLTTFFQTDKWLSLHNMFCVKSSWRQINICIDSDLRTNNWQANVQFAIVKSVSNCTDEFCIHVYSSQELYTRLVIYEKYISTNPQIIAGNVLGSTSTQYNGL